MSKEIERHVLDLYNVEKLLGSGAYGHVWKVKDRKSNRELALKKIFDAFQNSTDAQRTYRQITVLHELSHINIIRLERVIPAKNNRDLYLVFEYMEADLHSVVGEGILENVHHRFIIYQILRALKYLHSAELIHRDLKPSNILINSECQVKLCDFGLVRSLAPGESQQEIVLSEEVATRWYRSPQVLLGSQYYGKPADMWSVGCIVVEMLRGQPMFPGSSTLDQLQKIVAFTGKPSRSDIDSLENPLAEQIISQANIMKLNKLQIFSKIDPCFMQLIQGLLKFNPTKRLTVEQALDLEMFEEFRNQFEETLCSKLIIPAVNDNIRLGLKKYREIIYQDISKRYPPIDLGKVSQKVSRSKQRKPTSKSRTSKDSIKSKSKQKSKASNHKEASSLHKQPLLNVVQSVNNLKRQKMSPADGGSVLKEKEKNSEASYKKSIRMYNKTLMKQKAQTIKKKQGKCMSSPNVQMIPFEELNKLYKYFK